LTLPPTLGEDSAGRSFDACSVVFSLSIDPPPGMCSAFITLKVQAKWADHLGARVASMNCCGAHISHSICPTQPCFPAVCPYQALEQREQALEEREQALAAWAASLQSISGNSSESSRMQAEIPAEMAETYFRVTDATATVASCRPIEGTSEVLPGIE